MARSPSAIGQPHLPAHYRPDIDGLRALAVTAVIAFHAFPQVLPGGFVGVDVFFVISGFLISGIIFAALRSESFSYADFYARRVRRIFPALALVLALSAAYGWLVLLPGEFRQLGKHILGSAGFVANFVFWGEDGYFDTAASLKPLQHIWSLGVEEQYYLLWPLLLVLAGRRPGRTGTLIAALLLLSLALNLYGVARMPAATFFLPFTRFWELSCGALLAYAAEAARAGGTHRFDRRLAHLVRLAAQPAAANIASFGGAALLAAGLCFIDAGAPFPGWRAVLPVAGTSLIIAGGRHAWLNRHLLASRPAVAVGLISYPLYLWHWPVLAFGNILTGGQANAEFRLLAVLASIALAILTYRVVEVPLRFGGAPVRTVPALLLAMTVIASGGMVISYGALPARAAADGLERLERAKADFHFPGTLLKPQATADLQTHVLAPATRPPRELRVLMVGDSNMQQYLPRVEKLAEEGRLAATSVVFATAGGCPPISNVHHAKKPWCDGFADAVLRYADNNPAHRIVVAALWSQYFRSTNYYLDTPDGGRVKLADDTDGAAYKALADLLRGLRRSGAEVWLVLNIPIGQRLDPRSMLDRPWWSGKFGIEEGGVSERDLRAEYGIVRERLRAVAAASDVRIVDPIPHLCVDGRCAAVDAAGLPIYMDWVHLRASFVRDRVHFLDDLLIQPPSGTPLAAPRD